MVLPFITRTHSLLHPYWVVLFILLAFFEDHSCTCKKLRGVSELHWSDFVNMKDGWDGSSSLTTEMSSERSVSFRALLSVWGDHRFALKCSPVFLSAWHAPLFICPFFREKNLNGFQVERKRQQSRWTRFLRWIGTYSRPMTGCCASNRWGEKNHSDTTTVCLSFCLFIVLRSPTASLMAICSFPLAWLISGCRVWLESEPCCPPRLFSKYPLSAGYCFCVHKHRC